MFCNKDCRNCPDEPLCYRGRSLFDDLEKKYALSSLALLETELLSSSESSS